MRATGSRLGALAAVLLLIAGCSAGTGDRLQDTNSPGPASAPNPASGGRAYEGATSQGLPISFTVIDTAIEDVEFGWRARCADGRVHTNAIGLGGATIRDGRFSVRGLLTTGGRAHVVGRLSGSEASGRLSRWAGSAFNTDCVARGIEWHAHLVRGEAPSV
jgi:hypothetical protein